MISDDKVIAAAREIARQLDTLLSDYTGDQMYISDADESSPEQKFIAETKLYVLDWLRTRWDYKKEPNEDLLMVAREALVAAENVK